MSVAKAPQELYGSTHLDGHFAALDHYGNGGWGPPKHPTETQQSWHELSATSRVPQSRFDKRQEHQTHDGSRDPYSHDVLEINRMT
ncbi:hypothetical protein ABW20_dc0106562 [Dactylellina cionopaga]|nr:hypothetical protein ABW20_dc0106562 [Dactylellina cionopaga]